MTSNRSTGIQRQNLHHFIQLLKREFPFPTENLANEFTDNLENLAKSCDHRGLTSTVFGHLDTKSSLYGIFHCVQESEGSVSVSYAFHTIEAEMATQGIKASIKSMLGVQEQVYLSPYKTTSHLAKSSLEELHKLGVTVVKQSGLLK